MNLAHCSKLSRASLPRTNPQTRSRSRHASTSTNSVAFPYPSKARPSAHEIFHLPAAATPADIKSRCPSRFCFHFAIGTDSEYRLRPRPYLPPRFTTQSNIKHPTQIERRTVQSYRQCIRHPPREEISVPRPMAWTRA